MDLMKLTQPFSVPSAIGKEVVVPTTQWQTGQVIGHIVYERLIPKQRDVFYIIKLLDGVSSRGTHPSSTISGHGKDLLCPGCLEINQIDPRPAYPVKAQFAMLEPLVQGKLEAKELVSYGLLKVSRGGTEMERIPLIGE